MQVIHQDGVTVVTPVGQVCEYNDEANAELMRLIEEAELVEKRRELQVVFDLKDVTFMNSSGLGVIMVTYLRVRRRGGHFALCNVPPRVTSLLKITQVDHVLDTYDNLLQVLEAFSRD